MSSPRRSPRVRGVPAQFDGRSHQALAHVPVVDLTELDDAVCCICGFSDEPLCETPCCENPVHMDCMGDAPMCPGCDREILDGDFEECVICCSQLGSERVVLPCCQQPLHMSCLTRSFESVLRTGCKPCWRGLGALSLRWAGG